MAPTTFTGLCRSASIAVPATPALRLQLLVDAGSAASSSPAGKPLNESAAALAWARDSLSNGIDPDTWPTTVPAALHPTLQGLYVLPPARAAVPPAAPASDFRRLADMIALNDPARQGQGAPALGPASAAAAPAATAAAAASAVIFSAGAGGKEDIFPPGGRYQHRAPRRQRGPAPGHRGSSASAASSAHTTPKKR
jgi:hypothetical protein